MVLRLAHSSVHLSSKMQTLELLMTMGNTTIGINRHRWHAFYKMGGLRVYCKTLSKFPARSIFRNSNINCALRLFKVNTIRLLLREYFRWSNLWVGPWKEWACSHITQLCYIWIYQIKCLNKSEAEIEDFLFAMFSQANLFFGTKQRY